jgi:hypothetical protein
MTERLGPPLPLNEEAQRVHAIERARAEPLMHRLADLHVQRDAIDHEIRTAQVEFCRLHDLHTNAVERAMPELANLSYKITVDGKSYQPIIETAYEVRQPEWALEIQRQMEGEK